MGKPYLKQAINIWIILLRFNAGYLNALSIMAFGTMTAGHTGSLTNAFIGLADGEFNLFFGPLVLLLCFFIGTITSGYFFPYEHFQLHLHYGILFFIFAAIYLGLAFIDLPSTLFLSCLTFLMGMQNGLFVFYRGVIVRTTILTGNITDIGVALGKRMRSKQFKDVWKIKFFTLNVFSFGAGAAVFALIFFFTLWDRIIIASVLNLLIGIYFLAIRRRFRDDFKDI